MARVRQDAAKLGAGWNPILEWYAKALAELAGRAVDDPTSWRYLAAIHGFDEPNWRGRGIISDNDPLPSVADQDRVWNQCQHGGWYFLPWHRGYLHAFEAIVADTVVQLGGPDDWALPYWNYFDVDDPNARSIPDAFQLPTLPDGSPNPLSMPPRGGTVAGPTIDVPDDIDLDAMDARRFTSAPQALGFGGGQTVFSQFSNRTGAVESDPHNKVHVMIGGLDDPPGYMSDPTLAGLDPIFWLHHCNIDRLWAAWLTNPDNVMESSNAWNSGPTRNFELPDASGGMFYFTPEETMPGGIYDPTYDDLSIGTGLGAIPAGLDDVSGGGTMPASLSPEPPPAATLVGANSEKLTVDAGGAVTQVRLEATAADLAASAEEQRIFLNLESIRGEAPSGALTIRISAPQAGVVPAADAPSASKSVALFGLAKASAEDAPHGGEGVNVTIDITEIARSLAQAAGVALDQLQIEIEQPARENLPPITVDRVSVYRQPVAE